MTSSWGSPLQVAPLLGDDAAVGPLAAGGGNSQHHAHGQRFLDLGGAGEEIPEIPLVQRAEADGLGGVDDTAAAQCQQEVRAGPPDQVDALVYLAAAGVGLDVGELCKGDARGLQGGGDGVIGAVAADGPAAGDQQYPAAAEPAHQRAGVFSSPSPKVKRVGE